MASQRVLDFGAAHTALKQGIVLEYLRSYQTLMRRQRFELSYIDAFAGSGWRRAGADQASPDKPLTKEQAAEGCALQVVKLAQTHPFNRYVLGDLKRKNVRSLAAAIEEARQNASASGHAFPPPEAVKVVQSDANELIADECVWLGAARNRRAVMFLDPYGMALEWNSLSRIAETKKADVWMLIPTGMALARVMPRGGPPPLAWRRCVDRFFGGDHWEKELYRQLDLFGDTSGGRTASIDDIERYVLQRLQTTFGEAGVHPTGLPLEISGRPSYLLAFVCSNQSEAAYSEALRIAGHLIARARRA